MFPTCGGARGPLSPWVDQTLLRLKYSTASQLRAGRDSAPTRLTDVLGLHFCVSLSSLSRRFDLDSTTRVSLELHSTIIAIIAIALFVLHATPEPSPDVCVSLESNEGKVDPERDELESPSAGTGFETPGQQCHPIWETGQTTADGF